MRDVKRCPRRVGLFSLVSIILLFLRYDNLQVLSGNYSSLMLVVSVASLPVNPRPDKCLDQDLKSELGFHQLSFFFFSASIMAKLTNSQGQTNSFGGVSPHLD